MRDFFTRFFRGEDQSKHVAKERLRLVLVQDRTSLSAQALEALKEDLIAVISKYLEIDESGPEVVFERDGESVALVATIPVKRTAGVARAGR
ncbi:MAG: cell division topological specificity factor MinE [Bacillota bacterium]|nr:cell division topological specificity factor MinE [Bacillota bacterium]REJ37001.1 MAG: cell division topological specificity factor MinE [Bacillota bacterium]